MHPHGFDALSRDLRARPRTRRPSATGIAGGVLTLAARGSAALKAQEDNEFLSAGHRMCRPMIQHCRLAAFPAVSCLQRRVHAVSHSWGDRGTFQDWDQSRRTSARRARQGAEG